MLFVQGCNVHTKIRALRQQRQEKWIVQKTATEIPFNSRTAARVSPHPGHGIPQVKPGWAHLASSGSHGRKKNCAQKYSWQTVSGIRNQMFSFFYKKFGLCFFFMILHILFQRLYEAADFIIRQRCSFLQACAVEYRFDIIKLFDIM